VLYPDAREGIGVLGLYDGEREAGIGAKTKNNTNTGDLGERRLTKELSGNSTPEAPQCTSDAQLDRTIAWRRVLEGRK
jgi:hypothetical protein